MRLINPFTNELHATCLETAPLAAKIKPSHYLPYEEFSHKFSFTTTSTELQHPITARLSEVMSENPKEGLKLLLNVDRAVLNGLRAYEEPIQALRNEIDQSIKKAGRIFILGAGSSGRVAIDLAAKCAHSNPFLKNKVIGIIAGGFSAMVRAKEGSEDSESEGAAIFSNYDLNENDLVIVISASGSSSFNVGAAKVAADNNAKVFYFYNSTEVPQRTTNLFERPINPIRPLLIDLGAQAIAGSTRMQAASIAITAIGTALMNDPTICLTEILNQLSDNCDRIEKSLDDLVSLVKIQKEILSDPNANFRQLYDINQQGYITLNCNEGAFREVFIDATELSPTFSLAPQRRLENAHLKSAEFQTFLIGEKDNRIAWNVLLGQQVNNEKEVVEMDSFIIASETNGLESYSKRPRGKGNMTIAVAKLRSGEIVEDKLLKSLLECKKMGGKTGLLVHSESDIPSETILQWRENFDAVVVLNNIANDPLGIIPTVTLKQVLNLISTGTMVSMNKVFGNQMIDLRASNYKLIERCIRLVKSVLINFGLDQQDDDARLYESIISVHEAIQARQNCGQYSPSVVKIAVVMLAKKCSFEEAIQLLNEKNENLNLIL